MAAGEIPSVLHLQKTSALGQLTIRVASPPLNSPISLQTPLKSQAQAQPSQAIFPQLLSFRNPLLEATRFLGRSNSTALEKHAQHLESAVSTPNYLKAAMVESGQRPVGQLGGQNLDPSLAPENAMDLDMGQNLQMMNTAETPRHGSTSSSGLLLPHDSTDRAVSQQRGIHPFMRNNGKVSHEKATIFSLGSTPATRGSVSPMSISTATPLGPMRLPRLSRQATDQKMCNAPDSMMALQDPYFPNHPMVSQNEVGNATSALFQHMKHRFNPTLNTSRGIKSFDRGRTLPPPMPEVSHQNSLLYRGRQESRPVTSQLQPSDHMIAPHPRSLAGMLEQREGGGTAKFHVRQLDGISFHRVLQMPFTNELRAHYAAEDKSHSAGRAISMCKAQLSFPNDDSRSSYGHKESELWYFFEIRTPQTSTSADSCVILAIPASDLEENKAEECPMFRGGVQINARRREYSVKPFGRFRLECVNMGPETQTLERGIRHDLEDGSCRLFTWTEV